MPFVRPETREQLLDAAAARVASSRRALTASGAIRCAAADIRDAVLAAPPTAVLNDVLRRTRRAS